jgi:activating signal cointegrator complex subunit 3
MLLTLSKCVDRRMWEYECPLRQLDNVKPEIIARLEEKHIGLAEIHEMDAGDIGGLLRNPRLGDVVKGLAEHIPALHLDAQAKPITRTVLRITVTIEAAFRWHDRHNGTVEPWWIVVEDPDNDVCWARPGPARPVKQPCSLSIQS